MSVHRRLTGSTRAIVTMWLPVALAAALAGCSTFAPAPPSELTTAAAVEPAVDTSTVAAPATATAEESPAAPAEDVAALAAPADAKPASGQAASDTDLTGGPSGGSEEQYDPWERFNEKMFNFNLKLDRYLLKPVAKAYNKVMADELQVAIANGFDNLKSPPRFINSLLQGKWQGAFREAVRFVINTTAGFGGLFDPARDQLGILKSDEDFGQTLGVWGAGPGPYLVLPLLDPMTVRDGIGRAVDGAMDPLPYFIPFFPDRLLITAGQTINDRSLNLELFQGVEETTIDLYSAVRHFYLKRREQQIKE